MDGLVFARQLLVTGLPQGPFLVATTVRGSPEGGNRAQYAINWNLRISRQFVLPVGRLAATADILNVINAGERLQEYDLSGCPSTYACRSRFSRRALYVSAFGTSSDAMVGTGFSRIRCGRCGASDGSVMGE